jgi:hypothetical protein
MNPWKLNVIAGHLTREAICRHLDINHSEVYRAVKDVRNNIIELKNGKIYKLKLEEIDDTRNNLNNTSSNM